MKEQAPKSVATKLQKLVLLARELRAGADFQITRLTVLKSWCEDPLAAGRFALHLADRSKGRATKKYKPLIANALRRVKRHLANREGQADEALWQALRELEDSQNEYRDTRWGRVRTIHCREALLAEHALRCVARPRESAHWGYQAARQYAERYNPRYVRFYNRHRPHQVLGNRPFQAPSCPSVPADDVGVQTIRCRKFLGGLLRHYNRDGA